MILNLIEYNNVAKKELIKIYHDILYACFEWITFIISLSLYYVNFLIISVFPYKSFILFWLNNI